MKIPYSFVAPKSESDAAHLYILGDIVEGAWLMDGEASPVSIMNDLMSCSGNEVVVHIDSYGGDTSAGVAIYNLLKAHEGKVTTVTEGFACSAASLIFMAGDSRIMKKSSLLMIHNAWTMAQGNADELRKTADDLDKISATAAEIYAANCALLPEEIKKLLDSESWITPDEALEYGFATAIEVDETLGGQSHSSAFRCIFDQLTAPKTAPEAPKIEEKAENPAEKQPEHEEVKTPFQRFFGNLH